MRLGPGKLVQSQRGAGPAKWTIDYADANGRRHRKGLSTDRRVAQRVAGELIRRRDLAMAGVDPLAGMDQPLADLAKVYIDDLALRTVSRHWKQAQRRLARVIEALGSPRVIDLKAHALARMRAQRVNVGLSHRSANLEVDTVRACLAWAVKMGLIAQNPVAALPRLPETRKHKRRVRRALSEEEIERFLHAAEDDDDEQAARLAAVTTIANGSKGPQWALRSRRVRVPQAPLWRAFVETGARYGELTGATWRDVDLQRATLTLRAETTKSGKSRVIPLTDALVGALVVLRREHEQIFGAAGERVFLSPDGAMWSWATTNAMRTFDRLCARAGIERVDADGRTIDIHALRHSFASRLARNGVGLAQAQKLLGHSDPKLTAQAYTHLEVDDLRGAIETLNTGRGGRMQPRSD